MRAASSHFAVKPLSIGKQKKETVFSKHVKCHQQKISGLLPAGRNKMSYLNAGNERIIPVGSDFQHFRVFLIVWSQETVVFLSVQLSLHSLLLRLCLPFLCQSMPVNCSVLSTRGPDKTRCGLRGAWNDPGVRCCR